MPDSEATSATPEPNGQPHQHGGSRCAPRWSWLVLVSAATSNFFMFGSYSSFSVYYIDLVDEFGQGAGATAWIGALATGCSFLVGPLGSWLTTKTSPRTVVILGSLTCAIGYIASSYVHNLYILYFTYGFLTGLGFGISHVPGIVSVNYYFSKDHRTLATALAMAGGGAGQLGMPPVSRILVGRYGWRGSMWLQAGLALQLCWCGALLRPVSETEGDCNEEGSPDPLGSVESLVSLRPSRADNADKTAAGGRGSIGSSGTLNRAERSFQLEQNVLLLMCASYMWATNMFIVIVFTSAYTVHQGSDLVTAALVMTVLGLFNTAGRVVAGLLSRSLSIRWLFAGATTLHGLSTVFIPLAHDFPAIATFTAGVGLFYGMKWGILPAVLVDMFGLDQLSKIYGYSMFAHGLGGLTGVPLGGWILDLTGSYTGTFIFAGSATLFSTVLLILMKLNDWRTRQPPTSTHVMLQNDLYAIVRPDTNP